MISVIIFEEVIFCIIVNMVDIIEAIESGIVEGKEYLDKMYAYREQYGVK